MNATLSLHIQIECWKKEFKIYLKKKKKNCLALLIPPGVVSAGGSLMIGDVKVMVTAGFKFSIPDTIMAASSTHRFNSYFSSGATCYKKK